MRDLMKDKMFITGVLFGIFLFILLNIFLPIDRSCDEISSCSNYGYPFPFYLIGREDRDGGELIEMVLWTKLIINLLFAGLLSFLSGLVLNLLTEKD